MSEEISIVLLDIESIDAQLQIHQAAFGTDGILINKDYWIKKHYKNPLGNSLIFGASVKGHIVGMNAYMPVEYVYAGKKHSLLQSCESGVLPEFQGRGIWGKIVRYALDYISSNTQYEAVIGFPNYQKSYPGFIKMGWVTIHNMENYVMINNATSFSDLFFDNKPVLKYLSRIIFLQRLTLPRVRGLFVEEGDYKDLFWDEDGMCVHRYYCPELYKWRASYTKSKYVVIRNKNKVVASCIYHIDGYGKGFIIKIEQFVPENEKFAKKALSAVVRYFSKHYPEVAFVRIWATDNSILKKRVKQLFFIRNKHQNPFIISNPQNELSNKSWYLTFYDLD